jgi:hypothetical protein
MPENNTTDLQSLLDLRSKAQSKLEEAQASGDNALVSEISADIESMNPIINQVQYGEDLENDVKKKESIDILAKPVKTRSDKQDEFMQSTYSRADFSWTPEEKKNYYAIVADVPKTPAQVQGHLSAILGVEPDKVDIQTGLDASTRAELSLLYGDESKLDYLKRKFPSGVSQVNIEGTTNYVITTSDGRNVLADEWGATMKDAADVAGEFLPTTAAVVGAVIGARKGGGKNPALPSLISNAAQLTVGSLQDVASRYALGMDIKPAEIAFRRGADAIIGLSIDKALGMIGSPLVKRIGTPIENEFASKVSADISSLARQGYETTAPIKYLFGKQALQGQKVQMARLGENPILGSGPQRAAQKTLEVLSGFKKAATGDVPDTYASTINILRNEAEVLAKDIAKSDKEAALIVSRSLNSKLDGIVARDVNNEQIGNTVRGHVVDAEEQLINIKNREFNDFYNIADQQQVVMDKAKIIESLKRGRNIITNGQGSFPAIDGLINELQGDVTAGIEARKLEAMLVPGPGSIMDTPEIRETIADMKLKAAPLSAKDVNFLIRRAKTAVDEGGSFATGSPSMSVAERASQQLTADARNLYKSSGLSTLWDQSVQKYQNALNSASGLNSRILDMNLGKQTMTPTQVTSSILQDPQYIRDVISLAGNSSAEAAIETTSKLKLAYLDKIGLSSNSGVPAESFKFDDEIVNELWGRDAKGNVDLSLGNKMVEKLNNLKQAFGDSKIKIKDVDPREVDQYFQSMSTDEQKSIADRILKSSMMRQKQDQIAGNKLMQVAMKGSFDVMDQPIFVQTAMEARPSDLKSLMNKLPSANKESFKMDFVRQLFSEYQSDVETKTGRSLWNGAKVLKSFEGKEGNVLKNRIEVVMGKDFLKNFESASRMVGINTIKGDAAIEMAAKSSIGGYGIKFFLGVNLARFGADRVMSSIYGAGFLNPLFKVISKDVGPEKFAKSLTTYSTAMTATRAGIQAIAHTVRNDANAQQAINSMFGENTTTNEDAIRLLESNSRKNPNSP